MTRYVDAESIRKVPFRTIFIEVETSLLADLLGQRFIGPDGGVLSMEQVDLRFDPGLDLVVGEPLIIRMEPDNADTA